MPNSTTNFSFNKPLVNDAVDEDLWGGQLNDNWDSIDTLLNQFIPIGTIQSYAGTASPNAKWLLCDGAAVSRTTYATLFALVATSYGVGDGSTTFNLPDYRGRAGVGLDNLGGSSANRITDANADSLNNTGMGAETDAGSITVNSVTLTASNIPPLNVNANYWNSTTAPSGSNHNDTSRVSGGIGSGLSPRVNTTVTGAVNPGSASSFTPTGSFTGTTGSNVQASIAEGRIIRAL